MAINKIKTGSIQDNTVTSDDIQDGAITNAKVNACAAIAQSKVSGLATSISNLCSSISSVSSSIGQQANNIALLGFKMAVNDGLTVFNLVDGVVDEFNDESGTDESEGSNDTYNATDDYYINSNTPDGGPNPFSISAGFTTTSVTEPDTSTAGTNPTTGSGGHGNFVVPCGTSTISVKLWGAGGGPGMQNSFSSGGGGFTSGNLAVTPGQTIYVGVGEAGAGGSPGPISGAIGYAHAGADPALGAPGSANHGGMGGGASGIGSASSKPGTSAPQVMLIASGGGGGAGQCGPSVNSGGGGGGLTGLTGGSACAAQTGLSGEQGNAGGGGDQEQGGQGGNSNGQTGSFLQGGLGGASPIRDMGGSGGGGYYGGGGGGWASPQPQTTGGGGGGGGSSYYGHPQVSCGATEAGTNGTYGIPGAGGEGGGVADPAYVASTNEGGSSNTGTGEDGYILITGCGSVCASVQSTTIVSDTFTSTSVATSSRIVVFEENVDTPTLNTDIIASVSRDAGVTYTNATLSDSGYVTGSSGQRILTGQADISGQPSGQSMRWKLALANNTVKIHGVALQWS